MKSTTTPTTHTTTEAQASAPGKAGSPTPEEVRALRLAHGHTQAQAAELVHMRARAWQKYEGGESAMHAAVWELYRIKCAMR
jgi:putative transcriptional regulator